MCAVCYVTQFCPTLRNVMDYSLPGSSVHGILQIRILEWIAMPSSRGSSWPRDWTSISMSPALAGGCFTVWAPGTYNELWSYVKNNIKRDICTLILTAALFKTAKRCPLTDEVSIDRWMGEQNAVYTYYGVLLLLLGRFSRVRLCATP